MRAAWSFWSTPYRAHYHANWTSEKHHLLAWALSVSQAARHYEDTWLCTDEAGAELLVDRLGLPFRSVDLRLEALNAPGTDDGWWVLGKLEAYAAQTGPFVHLDSDVFLWRPLPQRLIRAGVFAQNPERFDFEDQSLYRIDAFMAGVARFGGWLPPQWRAFAEAGDAGAVCCGILGGCDADFIGRYARLAMEVVRHPANQAIWPTLGVRDNILVEQYFLAACLHNPGPEPAFLFASSEEAFDDRAAARAGYTHLIGDAKRDARIAERLERRVCADYPALYERCCEHARWIPDGRRSASGLV
jgi:hypothetical protein